MTFEEEFPSLKGYVIEDLNESKDDWNRFKVSIGEVQKYTLDRQRVREAILKCKKVVQETYKAEYNCDNAPEFDVLFEELGLED